jgi:formamidopyrimidine-DNA glycosylase
MPELPEVEGMKRRLAGMIVGRTVTAVEDISGQVTQSFAGKSFEEGVVGASFAGTGRRAKNLLLTLSTGDTLVMHFMREGMLQCVPAEEERHPLTKALLRLDDGTELRLIDAMKTARWTLAPGTDFSMVATMRNLGPEYWDPEFTVEYLASKLNRKAPLKNLLVDQAILAGVGNAYAHEICWEAKVLPQRPANTLDKAEIARLHAAVKSVFDRAIEARVNSTLSIMGDEGWEVARIHRRKGQPCPVCGTAIAGEKVGTLNVYFCPKCQR